MGKWIALFIAAFFAFVSFMGFWFHVAVGPSHGPGFEVAVIAGVAALIAGVVRGRGSMRESPVSHELSAMPAPSAQD